MNIELLFITPEAEKLIEIAGRTSRLTFKRQGEDTEKEFIRAIIRRGHYSVLEHAYAMFRISAVSRAFTHQMVRHRLCSFTQQSQRYVDESKFSYVEPDSIKTDTSAHALYLRFMEDARKTYLELQRMGIDNEDARFVLPNATESQIVVTANLREWRHIIRIRGSPNAQWEIRRMAIEVLRILKNRVPTVFEDFKIDEKNSVVRKARRV